MNNKISFSIIMPIFKRREMVSEAIDSVLNQINIDIKSVEIILVEDEKDNKVVESNRHYYQAISQNVKYLLNTNEEGPGGARQTGLAVAKGKYIVFLDSDDILMPDYLQRMKKVISDDDSVAVLCLSNANFESGFDLVTHTKINILRFIRDSILIVSYFINGKKLYNGAFYLPQFSHLIFNRSYIKDIKFNYDYRRGGEDWDFFVKSLLKGSIKILPKKLLLFRYSTGSSTSNKINLLKKWESYSLLAKRLPKKFKSSVFYILLKIYINSFSHL